MKIYSVFRMLRMDDCVRRRPPTSDLVVSGWMDGWMNKHDKKTSVGLRFLSALMLLSSHDRSNVIRTFCYVRKLY